MRNVIHEVITTFIKLEYGGYASIIKPKISKNLHIMVLKTDVKKKAINDAKRMANALKVEYLGEWINHKVDENTFCMENPKYTLDGYSA